MLKFRWVLVFLLSSSLIATTACRQRRTKESLIPHPVHAGIKRGQNQKPLSPAQTLAKDLGWFRKQGTRLPPKEAAAVWVDLLERYLDLEPEDLPWSYRLSLQELAWAIPPPASWPEVSRLLREQIQTGNESHDKALRLFAQALVGDPALERELEFLRRHYGTKEEDNTHYRAAVIRMGLHTVDRSSRHPMKLREFEKTLKALETSQPESRQIVVPNLIAMVGEERARELVSRAFTTPAQVLFRDAGSTLALAPKVILENIEDIPVPRWGFVNSSDGVELYEAMLRKWPEPGRRFREAADRQYLIGLILTGRTEDAVQFEKGIGTEVAVFLPPVVEDERAAPLFSFFHDRLLENPDAPYWTRSIQLAAVAGELEKMAKLLKRALAGDDREPRMRRMIQERLIRAHLAADRIEDAVKSMRDLLSETIDLNPAKHPEACRFARKTAFSLVHLGSLLDRGDWRKEGLDRLVMEYDRIVVVGSEAANEVSQLCDLLFQADRGVEAETVFREFVKKLRLRRKLLVYDVRSVEWLPALTRMHYRAGRYREVVRLFDRDPNWGIDDIREHIDDWVHSNGALPTAYVLADSLAEIGREAAARRIAREFLYEDPDEDRFYRLLVELEGQNLLPFLDELYARDRFEERPLIWKAHLLREAGRLDEAEVVVKQAIALDPSDGDQGKGDRMRVYEVYADILRDRGNAEREKFYRDVIKAIRLAEGADELYGVGLHQRALRQYQQSLSFFSDAYCIQSRMAIRLSKAGRHEEAAEHYAKAFELMPESFGQIESHCFGCEGVFAGDWAEDIAERVFERLAEAQPGKAQVHYLLGQLRQHQKRSQDALRSYLRATELDPDYLNAWKRINELEQEITLPWEVRERVTLNSLRLDPLHRHLYPRPAAVRNLARLWNGVQAAQDYRRETPASVYPLKASAWKLSRERFHGVWHCRVQSYPTPTTPGEFVVATDLVRSILGVIEPGSFFVTRY